MEVTIEQAQRVAEQRLAAQHPVAYYDVRGHLHLSDAREDPGGVHFAPTCEPIGQDYPVAALPIPEHHPPIAPTSAPDAQYLALATKLGIRSPAILEAQLEGIIAEEHLHVYDYEKVVAYLDNEVNKRIRQELEANPYFRNGVQKTIRWHWHPVRVQDTDASRTATSERVYTQEIPYPVLLTIDKIGSRLPEAQFFVSEVTEMPDPFLAVSVPGPRKMWVLERWSEPSFRG